MQPKISVIITVYNSEKYIEECIRSLLGQTLDYLEYIIVNDVVKKLVMVQHIQSGEKPWCSTCTSIRNRKRIGRIYYSYR